mgnify:FL=1
MARYTILKDGRIWSKYKRKYIGGSIGNGYKQVTLTSGGKATNHAVHRLVAQAFVPNPHSKPYVNHIDGNKLNNHYTNLEWCTAQENVEHARIMGLLARQVRKLTDDQVREIRKLRGRPLRYIAQQIGGEVTTHNVRDVLNGKVYTDVT